MAGSSVQCRPNLPPPSQDLAGLPGSSIKACWDLLGARAVAGCLSGPGLYRFGIRFIQRSAAFATQMIG
jgi:hypothetical protein